MNRTKVNYVLDAALLLLGVAVLATGLLLAFVVPRGSGRRGVTLWGLGRHDWSDVHFWIAVSMVGAVVLHLVLHWDWVHATTGRYLGLKTNPRGSGKWWSLLAALGVLSLLTLGVVAAGRWSLAT